MDWTRNINVSYYPCLKYRIPANKDIDGTDSFMVAESMKFDVVSEGIKNKFSKTFYTMNRPVTHDKLIDFLVYFFNIIHSFFIVKFYKDFLELT